MKEQRSSLFSCLLFTSPLEKILNQMGQLNPKDRPETADVLNMLDDAASDLLTVAL